MNETDALGRRRHEQAWFGGEGGDRTHGPVARTAVFETNHSQNLAVMKPSGKGMKALMGKGNSVSWLLHPVALSVR